MRIAFCDDDKHLIEIVQRYTVAWGERRGEHIDAVTFSGAEAFLFHWSPAEQFDLLFLDIQMGAMNGMKLAQVIRTIDQNLPIVFITGSREFVFDGYDVGALNYLLKPVREADVHKCLDLIYDKISYESKQYLVVTAEGKTQKIPYSEIFSFESQAHYVVISTKDGTIRYKQNISEVEQLLEPRQFIRIHRSYIVNLLYARQIDRRELVLENGARLPISKTSWQQVNEAFIRYHKPMS